MTKKNGIIWIVSILVSLCCLLLPESAGFYPKLNQFLAITVFAILIFAFDLLNQTVVALALMFVYAIGNFADSTTVFAVFTQPVLWAVLGGLLLANILVRIGLLRRIALKCIIALKGSYRGLIYGMVIASVLISFLMNNGTIPMVVFAFGVCKALDLKPSRESAAIMMAAAMPTNMIYLSMYSATYVMMDTIGGSAGVVSQGMTYLTYLKTNWPMLITIVIFALLLPVIMKPEKEREWKADLFKRQLADMGNMSRQEWFGLVDCILLLIFMLTGNLHGINIVWGLAVAPLLLYIPGVNTGVTEDVTQTKWAVFIFAAASITIGNVAGALQFGNVLAQNVLPFMQNMNGPVFAGFTTIFAGVANFLMTPISLATTFCVPFGQIAGSLGVNPQVAYMSILMGSDLVVLPYEGAMYYVIFAMGMIKMKDWIKICGWKILIQILCFMLLLLPYWYLIGFLYL